MRLRNVIWILVLLLAMSGIPWPARGDTPSPTPTATVSSTPSPSATPVPVADLATDVQSMQVELRDIQAQLDGDQALLTIKAALPVLTREITARLGENSRLLAARPSLETLRQLERDWTALGQDFPNWQRDLSTRGTQLDSQIARLNQVESTWKSTLASIQALNATVVDRSMMTTVQQLIDSIKSTSALLVERQGQLFVLQTAVGDESARVSQALSDVTRLRQETVSRVFAQDSPPLWSGEIGLQLRRGLFTAVPASMSTQLTALLQYLQLYCGRLFLHVLIFCLFYALTRWLHRRIQPMVAGNDELERATTVFTMPAATALLLSLLCVHWAEVSAPRLLGALIGAVALVPSLAILRKLVERAFYPLLNALMVFYVLDQMRVVAESLPLMARLLLLFESLCAIAFVLWFDRRAVTLTWRETEQGNGSAGTQGVNVGIRLFLLMLLVDTVANLLGFVSLATLIGNGVMSSIYLGVIFYGLLKIMDGLVVFANRVPFGKLRMMQTYRFAIRRRVYAICALLALGLWIEGSLEAVSLREPVMSWLTDVLTADLSMGTLHLTLGRLIDCFLTIWLAFYISRFVRFVLEQEVYPRVSLGRGVPYAMSQSVQYLVLAVGLVTALGALGVDMTKVTVVAGALSVGIGFGLQNIFNNFVSGIILLIDRPVNVGDFIQLGDAQGELTHIGMRYSILTIGNGSDVIVPNSDLINNRVVNWSRTDLSRRVDIQLSVDNETLTDGRTPQLVADLLVKVAGDNPDVSGVPAAQAVFLGLTGKQYQVELRAWVDEYRLAVPVKSELIVQLRTALQEAGVGLIG